MKLGKTEGRWRVSSQKIALQLRTRMSQMGLTQRQMADALGCSQQYISTILKGRENLTLDTLCRIEDALGIQIALTGFHFTDGYGTSSNILPLSDCNVPQLGSVSSLSKTLYIIAGCNGAGKTTASVSILPGILACNQFVNADEIARGLSPFNPESVAIMAGRLMLDRINNLLNGNESFAIETTLATRSYVNLVERAHQKGFSVTVLFFWLPSPRQAMLRVAKRVSEGGHDIPSDTIKRRYHAGLSNFFKLYMPIADNWILVDNHSNPRCIIAEGHNKSMTIKNKDKYGDIIAKIK